MGTETVWGVCMARNEADIIGPVVAHMVTQVDHVLVADNLSTDDTAAIARDAGAEVITDDDPAYRQSEKMTALARRAAAGGADWVIPFDADEVWLPVTATTITTALGGIDAWVATADLYDHVPTADDSGNPNPVARIGWRRRTPGALPKVACRTRPGLTIAMGNHGATYPDPHPTPAVGLLEVRHFPYRDADQFVRKAVDGAAALRLARLPLHTGAHWRDYARIAERDGPDALADVFRTWFHSDDPVADPTLVYDPI